MDPTNEQFPVAPASPAPVPGIPASPLAGESVGGGLSQEEMVKNLEELMAKIEGKYQDFNSQKFATNNKLQESKSETLRQIFDVFESLGIDVNNVEEVRAFLDKLRESNPELSQQLEQALQTVLGDEVAPAPSDVVPVPETEGLLSDNMNINNDETTSQNV